METIANLSKIAELEAELASMVKARKELPRLSVEDHEDVSDNYQMHLELGYEIDRLRDEIKALKQQLG